MPSNSMCSLSKTVASSTSTLRLPALTPNQNGDQEEDTWRKKLPQEVPTDEGELKASIPLESRLQDQG